MNVREDKTGREEGRGEEVDARKRPTGIAHGEGDGDGRQRAGTHVLRRYRKGDVRPTRLRCSNYEERTDGKCAIVGATYGSVGNRKR